MKIALFAGLSLPLTALAHEHGGANPAGELGHGTTTSVRELTVVEREDGTMGFSPDALRVKRGETVRFDITNAGKANHEFRIDSVAGNAAHEAMMRAMPDMKHHEGNSVALAPGTTGHLAWDVHPRGHVPVRLSDPRPFRSRHARDHSGRALSKCRCETPAIGETSSGPQQRRILLDRHTVACGQHDDGLG